MSGDCRDYTFEDCNFANGPFETAKDLDDASICQQFCSLVYTEDCTFFVWDRINVICELYDYNMTEYLNSCKTLGGSPSPGLEACEEYVDKCMVNIIDLILCCLSNYILLIPMAVRVVEFSNWGYKIRKIFA